MMAQGRVAVVTGANKGIGLAITRHLALQNPASSLNNGPFLIYLTARDRQRGEDALKSLEADAQLQKARALHAHGGLTTIKYQPLDISETASVQALRDFLKKEHPDGIDVVVNNAGIALQGFDNHVVKTTLEVNYYGTLEACQDLLPLIRPQGRLVNVSSIAGMITKYSEALQARFRGATSVPEVTKLMEEFKAAAKAGREKQEGWTSQAYAASKAGVTGMTRVLAHEETARCEREGKPADARLINACCPGWVVTDMTRGAGHKNVDQGAQTPVLLALGDINGQSGQFWEDERPRKW